MRRDISPAGAASQRDALERELGLPDGTGELIGVAAVGCSVARVDGFVILLVPVEMWRASVVVRLAVREDARTEVMRLRWSCGQRIRRARETTWSDDPDANPSAPLISSHELSYVDHGVYMDGDRVSDVFGLKGADSSNPCYYSTCKASWAYDARDRLLREATGTGPNTTYVMDVYGQNTQEWTTTATTSPTNVLTRSATYNGTQLASDTSGGVTQEYFYDSVGNLACVMTGDYTGSACPDADTVPTTLITRYGYDSKNRLVSMADYSAGSPTTSAIYVLDALDRTLSRNEDNYGIVTRTDYVYIGLSNAIAQERAFGSTGPGGNDVRPESVHDVWGWGGSAADLTYAVADDNGATYDFSTGGAAYYVDWNLEDMGFDPGNGLSSLSVSLANTSDFGIDIQVVDASGNIVAHTGYTTTGGSLTYTPSTPLGPTAASDLRVRVVNDPATWNALYARVNTVRVSWTSALINPSGLADLKSYSYDANGRPLTLTDTPAGEPRTSVSYIYDPGGSVAAIVDQNRNVKASYGYTAYGQSNLSLASNAHGIYPRANPVQYAGSQYDIASGTYDVNDHHYSPALQRYLGADRRSTSAGSSSLVAENRRLFESSNDNCLVVTSLACGSYALSVAAANREIASRIEGGRQQRRAAWNSAWWAGMLYSATHETIEDDGPAIDLGTFDGEEVTFQAKRRVAPIGYSLASASIRAVATAACGCNTVPEVIGIPGGAEVDGTPTRIWSGTGALTFAAAAAMLAELCREVDCTKNGSKETYRASIQFHKGKHNLDSVNYNGMSPLPLTVAVMMFDALIEDSTRTELHDLNEVGAIRRAQRTLYGIGPDGEHEGWHRHYPKNGNWRVDINSYEGDHNFYNNLPVA